jgi:hypothetical protein
MSEHGRPTLYSELYGARFTVSGPKQHHWPAWFVLVACLCHSLGSHTRRKTLPTALQVLQVVTEYTQLRVARGTRD